MAAPRRPRAARSPRAAGRPAGGSDDIVRTVLDEVLRQLVDGGFAALSIDAIARAAGVNKTSVYRRWPTKAALLIAALKASREREPPFVETGDVRADLVRLLSEKAATLSTPRGRAVAVALSAVQDGSDPTMSDALRTLRYSLPSAVIASAVARGELAAGLDAVFVAELMYAPIFHRLLVLNDAVDRAYIERVVDHVLAGLTMKAPAATPARRRKKQL